VEVEEPLRGLRGEGNGHDREDDHRDDVAREAS
jgi:hypothetical protein